jgi:diguanylate cyclase (GGDEF)-like protein
VKLPISLRGDRSPPDARIAALEAEIVRLRQAMLLDGVTDLQGRQGFLARLEEEVSHARVPGGFTVLLFDIDRFAAVNAAYGHAAGDEVLRRLARTLVDHLGPGDCVARIGDDQFAVVVLHAPSGASEAREWACRVSHVSWVDGEAPPGCAVTVSHGYAVFSPSCPTTDALLNESRRSLLAMRAAYAAGVSAAAAADQFDGSDATCDGVIECGDRSESPRQLRPHGFLRVVEGG